MYPKGKRGQERKWLEPGWQGEGRQVGHFQQWEDKKGRREREEKEILSAQTEQEGELAWAKDVRGGGVPMTQPCRRNFSSPLPEPTTSDDIHPH